MEDRMNYKSFLDLVNNFGFSNANDLNKFENIEIKINEFIPVSDEDIFYPQNIFVGDKDIILYFFSKNKIYRVTVDQDKIFFEVFNLKDVTNFNLEVNRAYYNENYVLNIFFTLDRKLVLNNLNDTNQNWRQTFALKIKEIYKILSEL